MGRTQRLSRARHLAAEDGGHGSELAAELAVPDRVCRRGGDGLAVYKVRFMVDKRTFCKRFAIWTAVVVAVVIAILGLCFGRIVEDTLAEEIGKWVVMGLFIVGIFEVFALVLAPFCYHLIYDRRKDPK